MSQDAKTVTEKYEHGLKKKTPYIPKNLVCPLHAGGRCMGSLCGRWVEGQNVCSDVASANALQHVASCLDSLHREVPELWKTIIAIYGQMYDTLKTADAVLKERHPEGMEG